MVVFRRQVGYRIFHDVSYAVFPGNMVITDSPEVSGKTKCGWA
jgi:hypothetical protein